MSKTPPSLQVCRSLLCILSHPGRRGPRASPGSSLILTPKSSPWVLDFTSTVWRNCPFLTIPSTASQAQAYSLSPGREERHIKSLLTPNTTFFFALLCFRIKHTKNVRSLPLFLCLCFSVPSAWNVLPHFFFLIFTTFLHFLRCC